MKWGIEKLGGDLGGKSKRKEDEKMIPMLLEKASRNYIALYAPKNILFIIKKVFRDTRASGYISNTALALKA